MPETVNQVKVRDKLSLDMVLKKYYYQTCLLLNVSCQNHLINFDIKLTVIREKPLKKSFNFINSYCKENISLRGREIIVIS